jgi:hypothetical protein
MKLTLKLIAIVLILATAFLLTDTFTSDAEAGWGCWALRAAAIATCATAHIVICLAAWAVVCEVGCC